MLKLSPVKQQIVLFNISAQETFPFVLCNETFKVEDYSQTHNLAQLPYIQVSEFLAYFNIFRFLRRAESQSLAD